MSLGRRGPGVRSGFLSGFSQRPAPAAVAFFRRQPRPRPSSQFPDMRGSCPAPLRGCGCRSRAARPVRLERRRGRRGPARVRPSRWAGPVPGEGPQRGWLCSSLLLTRVQSLLCCCGKKLSIPRRYGPLRRSPPSLPSGTGMSTTRRGQRARFHAWRQTSLRPMTRDRAGPTRA